MAYSNAHYPHSSSADLYASFPSNSRYPAPARPAARDPFATQSDLSLPQYPSSSYPPAPLGPAAGMRGGGTSAETGLYNMDQHAGSAWSLDDEPIAGGGAGGAAGAAGVAGYERVHRSADNPFSEKYRSGGGAGGGAGGRDGPRNWRKWILVAALLVLVVGGIAGGIGAWRANAGSSSSGGGKSGGLQFVDGTAKVVKFNPDDPSQFEPDSRLKRIFYGLAYTPKNVLEEYGCGATLANVTEDIILISQLTTRIRMYGTACSQADLTLQAIADTKVNMTVWLGTYLDPNGNQTINDQQTQWAVDAIQKHGTEHIGGVAIGNEYILNQVDNMNVAQSTAVNFVLEQQAAFRSTLAGLNLDKTLPVGTADAGAQFTAELVAGSDFVMANQAGLLNRWPTNSMTPNTDLAPATTSELQVYLDTYPCEANKNGTSYYFFEPFDEPWKERYGGVEPYWGLFDSNKVLKNITFPDCEVDSAHASG
ncbi:hypothetical protein Rhopal_002983-T1 [Rhodotorula paludigena]|uniref:glucan endo-1,3-beta-D-glucosidase n=1 Tax=Rhodotorula paludigena TaxID=86838 RepID=A0AAV5GHR6_9BASI|nr:hypothetical protein Rhopal_002983-T1 [Rhodotorula paludigena]